MSFTVVFGASLNFDFSLKFGLREIAGMPFADSFSAGGGGVSVFGLWPLTTGGGMASSEESADSTSIFFLIHHPDSSIAEPV